MSGSQEHKAIFSPIPYEIRLSDVMFLSVRNNLMLFKDLGKKQVHYSMFVYGSTIDIHKTLEAQDKHTQLIMIEIDWQFLMKRVNQEVRAKWKSIFQEVRITDPEWSDLEIDFIPLKQLMEFFPAVTKRIKLNLDAEFLGRIEQTVKHSRLEEMDDYDFTVGTGSGYFVFTYGTQCFLFDYIKMSEIIEKSFDLSIRKISLGQYTLSLLLWYVKIRLLIFAHSLFGHFRKPQAL